MADVDLSAVSHSFTLRIQREMKRVLELGRSDLTLEARKQIAMKALATIIEDLDDEEIADV